MSKISAKGVKIKHGTSANPTDVLAHLDTVTINVGDRELIDVTTHDSPGGTREFVDSGVRDTTELEVAIKYAPGNAGHEAIRAAHAAGTLYYHTLIMPDAGEAQWTAAGYITKFNVPNGGVVEGLKATYTFKAKGAETFTP